MSNNIHQLHVSLVEDDAIATYRPARERLYV
jgi:hypothetical protein